jgi:prepilin-type N-terminal cleavage/methylation domain-containing protein
MTKSTNHSVTDRGSNPERSRSGFTIVELLVVIVVIGILAAITIVSYAGVTARANSASAQSTANALLQKVEAYAADGPTNAYPATLATLTGAAATTSYYMSTSTVSINTALLTTSNLPTAPSQLNFLKCGTTGSATVPTNAATITVQSGVKIGWWDYANSVISYLYSGGYTTDPGTYLTYPARCFPAQT